MSELLSHRHRHRRRLEQSAFDLQRGLQKRVLEVGVSEDEQGDCSNEDDEVDGMPPRLLHRCTRVLRRLLSGKASPLDFVDFDVDGLLATRPARHWMEQIKHLGCQARALQPLRGLVTLYEALCAMGPDLALAAGMVQAVSQQRLFESCSVGFDMSEWSVPLEALLRSGASLLRTDSRGRVAAHLAAAAECDILGVLLHTAPAALLVEDTDGQTPLDLLVDSPCLGQLGARNGTKNALIDALLDCLCAFPQEMVWRVQKSEKSQQVVKKLAAEPGASALHFVACKGAAAVELEKCAAEVSKRYKKAQRVEATSAATLRCTTQRIRVLENMSSDETLEAAELEPQEMQLRIFTLENELRTQQRAAAEMEAALDQEVRRLKGLLAQCEDELLACRASVQTELAVDTLSSRHDRAGKERGSVMAERTDRASDLDSNALFEATSENYEYSVIQQIRQTRFLELENACLPESVRVGLTSMQASLAAAVNRLAKDLYDSETHFIHELIQNADDAAYVSGIVPELHFALRSAQTGELSFFYAASNETGFREADVHALCDVSRSTKSGTGGVTTGHKGVGWKAVFRVCHAPHVLSGNWRFRFSSEGLGMITPEWVSDQDYLHLPAEVRQAHAEGRTVFFLPLSRTDIVSSIVAELHNMEVDTAQLIFLRRLRRICISNDGHDLQMDLLPRRDESTTGVVNQCVRVLVKHGDMQDKSATWSTYTHDGATVACPLVEELSPQHIFAVLPVRKVGFNFAVQAQFQLTTSRADLHRCPENVALRNSAAHAFLNLCRSNTEVATRAVEYLGKEPADAFWLSARMMILGGLQSVACIPTEGGSGCLPPAQCLLRGDGPAAHWVPNDVLAEACGLHFVDPMQRRGDLCDFGVRKFGFVELCACLHHDNGKWVKAQWSHPSASRFFTDLYEQLVEDLQEEASRIAEVQKLRIFPVDPEEEYRICAATHSSAKAPLETSSAPLYVAADVYAAFCSQFPDDWQTPLIRRISPKLRLSHRGQALLKMMGVTVADEETIERQALRSLLGPESVWPCLRATWPALHVLCFCHSSGRDPPCPWKELRGAILLPSEGGELIPPSRLRLRSFLGMTPKLPAGIHRKVCDFAGLSIRLLEPDTLELVKMPAQTHLSWLEWEAFFWTLGCTYINPMVDFGEACVEATLELGRILSSTAFWQTVTMKPCVKSYLHATFGDLACPQLRTWLCQLPIGDGHIVLSDLFMHDVFNGFGGSNLPYLKLPSRDPDVDRLLRKLGIAMDLNAASLFKCLRWMKLNAIQDIGLVADIYGRLERLGCGAPPSEASVIFVPGRGYLCPWACSWEGLRMSLLRKCCPLQPISDYYARFGPGVRNLLASWVLSCPEADAASLCRTLRTLIVCATEEAETPRKPNGIDSVDRKEALDGLCDGARVIVDALAVLCKSNEADATMVRSMFGQNRMIITLGSHTSRDKPYYRLLKISEAYWSVALNLRHDPCAQWQLQKTYGADVLNEYFFVNVLGVRSVLHERDRNTMIRLSDGHHGCEQDVVEGLSFHSVEPTPARTPGNLARAIEHALNRARGLIEGAATSTASIKKKSSRRNQSANDGHVSMDTSGPARNATNMQLTTAQNKELGWRCIGDVGGFLLFSLNGVHPSPDLGTAFQLTSQCVDMLRRLCDSFSIEPDRVAFAYDPSGGYVGRENLFLDASNIPRMSKLPPTDAAISWTMELAQTIAHQGVGPAIDEDLLAVMRELTLLFLPKVWPTI